MKTTPKKRPERSPREQALDGPIFMKERGSIEWCYQKVAFLKDVLQMEQATVRQFDDGLNDLKEFSAWEKIPEGQPYGDLKTLLKKELGIDSEDDGRSLIERRISAAAAITDGTVRGRGRPKKIDPGRFLSQEARAEKNGIGYRTQQRLDRLAKTAPEMCRLVAEGHLTLPNAERAAGIAESSLKTVQLAWSKADADERRRIAQWVFDQIKETE